MVEGRLIASLTGMKRPVLASRPILMFPMFATYLSRKEIIACQNVFDLVTSLSHVGLTTDHYPPYLVHKRPSGATDRPLGIYLNEESRLCV